MSLAARGGRGGEDGIVDILYLLDRLEEVITSARKVPFGSSVMVDPQECLDIVDQVRLALPGEVKLARRVMSERDQILAEAQERADRVVERAEEHAAQRIDDHEIVLAAEERARQLLDRAEREAEEQRRQVDEYSYRVLASVQKRLRQLEATIQDSLEGLRAERHGES